MRPRAHLGVLVVFLGLVTVYTWPSTRDLGSLPYQTDERLFGWVMLSVFRNLWTRPGALLEGNAFYPFGQSLTFAEPLVTPSLLAGPLFAATGNAVAAYKLTLVAFWALSGWAMYAVAFRLTGRHPAALVAALVFTLSPPRIEYGGEFQMEMSFGIPLAVYTAVRFLETQRARHLAAFLAVFWLQAIAVWYYAIILALGLAVVVLQYAALRPAGWRLRTLGWAAVGAVALAVALAPVAWPYVVTHRELGFERGLGDIDSSRYADLVTYVATRRTWLERVVRIDTGAETSLFVGAVALALAAVGLLTLRRPDDRGGRGRAERVLAAAVWVGLAAAVAAIAAGRPVRLGPIRSPFTTAGIAVLVLALARQVAEGWRRRRAGVVERRLTDRDWVGVLLGLALFCLLLSLGPHVHAAGRRLGGGLYAWLYPYLLPLHVIRSPTRIGLLADFALALLAGFGAKWLGARLPAGIGRVAAAAAALALMVEYAGVPLPDHGVPVRPRAVDRVLGSDRADVAVLEWPTNDPGTDADAMFRSLAHGHRVVNGFSGFVPDWLRELSGLLSGPGPPLASPDTRAALRQIYPLRYLVVRLGDVGDASRAGWLGLRQRPPALLRFRGTFGEDDLYEVVPLPERGRRLARQVSPAFLRDHPVLRLTLRPLVESDGLDQWVDVTVGGRSLGRVPVNAATAGTVRLAPRGRAAPEVIRLDFAYRRPSAALDARYTIGGTGARSPGDLEVRSAGQPHGDVASIQLNGTELSPNTRGYDLVALDPAGRVAGAEAFDTFGDAAASGRLAAWVARLPAGSIVAGAVKDEASAALSGEAVAALATVGVRGDLRGRYRDAHAFVGVKGAPAGSALETMGPRAVGVVVGRPDPGLGIEVSAFELTAR